MKKYESATAEFITLESGDVITISVSMTAHDYDDDRNSIDAGGLFDN